LARHASRHNTTFEAGLIVGAVEAVGAGGAAGGGGEFAMVLDDAAGLGLDGGVGWSQIAQPLTVAASPAPPSQSSRRRLRPGSTSDGLGGTASMTVTIRNYLCRPR
jgi:hypothetical protein